ncbi:LysR family transcriptional regulator [Nocardioides sp. LML1-1-1.1]|uniref:LysR family transcriptional regulator n=1 Tax=Nocardioides sp. LML1-1-1.1 TaxID=3135248 RepID=UPI00342AE825
MDTKWLETFVAAAQSGTFAAAASDLRYARSTVTGHIRQLEAVVGVPLFVREGASVTMSDAGRDLLEHAPTILRSLDNALASARRERASDGARFGATEFGCCYHLPGLLKRLRLDAGPIASKVTADTPCRLSDRLRDGDLDIALIPRATEVGQTSEVTAGPHLRQKIIRREALALVAAGPQVERSRTVLAGPEQCVCRTATERDLLTGGRSDYQVLQVTSLDAVRASALAGLGLAVLPMMMIHEDLASKRLHRLPWSTSLTCVLSLEWRTDRAPARVRESLELIAGLR